MYHRHGAATSSLKAPATYLRVKVFASIVPTGHFRARQPCRRAHGVQDVPATMPDGLDLFDVRSVLDEEERMVQDSVRRLVQKRVQPIIRVCFE